MSVSDDFEIGAWPQDDFSAYGPVESKKLSRRQKLVGSLVHRNWLRIPHVFHQDEVDITRLEEYRQSWNSNRGFPQEKLTLLSFLIKAIAKGLSEFPQFNASLDQDGSMTFKKYFHIGVVVDTSDGLLVPVLRDCDKKDISKIATELRHLSKKASSKGLTTDEMAGGCITISSLGHIGGTSFTPIINAPQVAILGVTRAKWKPIGLSEDDLALRYCVPISLSYDHRVINGADAARFCARLSELLNSPEDLVEGFPLSNHDDRELTDAR